MVSFFDEEIFAQAVGDPKGTMGQELADYFYKCHQHDSPPPDARLLSPPTQAALQTYWTLHHKAYPVRDREIPTEIATADLSVKHWHTRNLVQRTAPRAFLKALTYLTPGVGPTSDKRREDFEARLVFVTQDLQLSDLNSLRNYLEHQAGLAISDPALGKVTLDKLSPDAQDAADRYQRLAAWEARESTRAVTIRE